MAQVTRRRRMIELYCDLQIYLSVYHFRERGRNFHIEGPRQHAALRCSARSYPLQSIAPLSVAILGPCWPVSRFVLHLPVDELARAFVSRRCGQWGQVGGLLALLAQLLDLLSQSLRARFACFHIIVGHGALLSP